MASLTEAAYYSRMAIKYGGILLVVMVVGRFVVGNAIKLYVALNPPEAPPPTVGFGVLPDLIFPEVLGVDGLSYSLETPTGAFPVFEDRARVFLMPNERPNLLALERATEEMSLLGYKGRPEQVSEVMFRWKNNEPVMSTLDMQIFEGTFQMAVDWTLRPEFLSEKVLPSESDAVVIVQSYLNRAHLAPPDLVKAKSRVSFLKAIGREMRKTVSLSEADFVRVDLYRGKIDDEYEVVTADPDKGVIQAVVSGNARLGQIVSVDYNYFPVNYEMVETYPLKSVAVAWSELEQGKGRVVRLNQGVEQVVVRRVTLAYYDSFEPQEYLQPVYVFTGDDNFVGYVAAVAPPSVLESGEEAIN